jgi:hypothetical protein
LLSASRKSATHDQRVPPCKEFTEQGREDVQNPDYKKEISGLQLCAVKQISHRRPVPFLREAIGCLADLASMAIDARVSAPVSRMAWTTGSRPDANSSATSINAALPTLPA